MRQIVPVSRAYGSPFEWGEMTQIKHTQICTMRCKMVTDRLKLLQNYLRGYRYRL